MEKWVRSLPKTTALVIGIVSLFAVAALGVFVNENVGGFIALIVLCGVLGGGIGFSFLMLYKGITGKTPQENKESQTEK